MSAPPTQAPDDAHPMVTGDWQSNRADAIVSRSTRALTWALAQGVFDKIAAALLQLALASLLQKRDFGLVALVYTVTTFASLIHQFGIRQTLLQRLGEFERWATPAFWMSAAIGGLALVVATIAAPIAARVYGQPDLTWLIVLATLSFPASAMAAVPDARLSADMRFGLLARINAASTVFMTVLTLILAGVFQYGPYAIIIPQTVTQILRLPVLWHAAGISVGRSVQLSDWRSLGGTSFAFFVASLAMMATYVGPFSVVGKMVTDPEVVGTFYLMHQLSDQATRLIMANLAAVLLPALTIIQGDPHRQSRAFERAVRILLVLGVPVCVVQAVLAGPAIRCLLPAKYESSGALLSLLSVFMVGRLVLLPLEAMLTAQKRHRYWLRTALVYAPVFLLMCVSGTYLGERRFTFQWDRFTWCIGPAEACTLGMMIALNIVFPPAIVSCLTPLGNARRRVLSAFATPIIGSATCAIPGIAIAASMPKSLTGDLLALLLVPPLMLGSYYQFLRRFAPGDVSDIVHLARTALPKRLDLPIKLTY